MIGTSSNHTKIDLEYKIEILELKLKILELKLKEKIKCPYCGHRPFSRCECCDGLISFCAMCG
jgi:transcription elongation factor Elf1